MLENDKFVRDEISKAVINTDVKGLTLYKSRKSHINEMKNIKNEVDSLKDEMTEIKNLLLLLVEKNR